jgi:hypothetical protein
MVVHFKRMYMLGFKVSKAEPREVIIVDYASRSNFCSSAGEEKEIRQIYPFPSSELLEKCLNDILNQ